MSAAQANYRALEYMRRCERERCCWGGAPWWWGGYPPAAPYTYPYYYPYYYSPPPYYRPYELIDYYDVLRNNLR